MSHSTTEHHVTPLSTYIKIYVALVILTLVTVAASRIDMGVFNTLVALFIATIKAGLVLAYFMHLKAEGKLNRVTIGSALLFAVIFYVLTASDIFTRHNYTEIALQQKIEALKEKKVKAEANPADAGKTPEQLDPGAFQGIKGDKK